MKSPSSGRGTEPPRVARAILTRLLGRGAAEHVEDSLAELFRLRVETAGTGAARRWYWRQLVGFARRRRALRSQGDPGRGGGRGNAVVPGMAIFEAWIRDLKLAVRSLRRQPGFAALAIGTLALGIGANTAIFSLIHSSLLQPLPFPEPGRLVWLSDSHEGFDGPGANQSVPNWMDIQQRSKLLQSTAVYQIRSGNLATVEEPERVRILRVSSEFLGVLGVVPGMGRDFLPRDDPSTSPAVAILTDGLWRARFGADPGVVGQTVTIDARSVQIVGVAPATFDFPGEPQVLMAMQHQGAGLPRGARGSYSIGRLAPGAELDGLREELEVISAQLAEAFPDNNEGFSTWADPLRDHVVGSTRQSLVLLGGAVAFVLLIACLNVANLMLARSEVRQQEFAVRYSLGATRAGLLSHFLSEGLVLSFAGGGLGILAAHWGVDALVALYGDTLGRASEIRVNGSVLAVGLATCVAVGTLVGLIPLLRSRPDTAHPSLTAAARGSSARAGRLGRGLVVAEIALAVLIVAAAGLLINSMWRLQSLDLGVTNEDRVLTLRVSLPYAKYRTRLPTQAFYYELLENLATAPGIEAVGLVNRLPLIGGDSTSVSVLGAPEKVAHFAAFRFVSSGYFDAVGVPLRAGRLLDAAEFADGRPAIVVNETLARQLFAGEDAVGRRLDDPFIRPGDPGRAEEGFTIVGIVGDIVGGQPGSPAAPAFYLPFARQLNLLDALELPVNTQLPMSLLVRTSGDPYAVVPHIRETVTRLDAAVPIFAIRTLQEIAFDRLGTQRFAMSLFGAFAGLALLLGAVGIYGVMSFGVARRSRELGVRLALGATRRSVMRMVLAEGAHLAAPGIMLGLALALASGRVLSGLLYDITALDPLTYVAVTVVLSLVTLAATYVPARRATRVDPLTSMRNE